MKDNPLLKAFPPSFDKDYYVSLNPELKGMSPSCIADHYLRYAEELGKPACEYDRREGLLALLKRNYPEVPLPEIGPWDNPSCVGENVKYFDVFSAEELKKRETEQNRPFHHVPAKIDYVHPQGDLRIVDKKFGIVFSSHVIEHQPDLVTHLKRVSDLLEDYGFYVMCIPDKRYIFEHFLPESTATELIEAFIKKREFYSFEILLNAACMITHNHPLQHWIGIHGGYQFRKEFVEEAKKQSEDHMYHDVHAWQFTPRSFQKNIRILHEMGYIDLSLHRICHTVWGRNEFVAILRKSNEPDASFLAREDANRLSRCEIQRTSYYLGHLEKKYHVLKDGIEGYFDLFRTEDEDYFFCRGWSICRMDKVAHGRRVLVAGNEDSEYLVFDLSAKERPDVVELFHEDQYLWCGFECFLDRKRVMSIRGAHIHIYGTPGGGRNFYEASVGLGQRCKEDLAGRYSVSVA